MMLVKGRELMDNWEGYEPGGSSEEPESQPRESDTEGPEDLMDVDREELLQVPGPTADDMVSRVQHREAIGNSARAVVETTPEGEVVVELGGGLVTAQKPIASRDDVSEVELDLGLTYQGMIKELNALESLAVGDLMWTIDPRRKVISTRWVVSDKTERVDGKETKLVCCRICGEGLQHGPNRSSAGDLLTDRVCGKLASVPCNGRSKGAQHAGT